MARVLSAAAIAAFVTSAFAAVSTKCPIPSYCFSLEVPDATLASGTGDIFLYITGPAAYAEITLAHHGNDRHDYFRVLTDAQAPYVAVNRTTVNNKLDFTTGSPTRLGLLSTNNQIDFAGAVEILPSSSVKDGEVEADIRCSTCGSKSGGSLDLSTPINTWDWSFHIANMSGFMMHCGTFKFDSPNHSLLSQLKSAYRPLVSRWARPAVRPSRFIIPAKTVHMVMAHGILACIAAVFVLPLGGIIVRSCSFRYLLWVHIGVQIFGVCLYTAALGLGIELATKNPVHHWIKDKHSIIGLTVYVVLLTQSASGYIHHLLFQRYISRTTWSYLHLWAGRLCITLAMINAGFGFQLRKQKLGSWKVASYTACAVFMWCAYVTSIAVGEWRRNKQMKKAASSSGLSPAESCVDMPSVRHVPKHV